MDTQEQSLMATKLLRAILTKSFIEVLLVCAVVTLAAFSTFSPQLRGAIDVADQTRIAGWVYDPQTPGQSLEVQLFVDERFVAAERADHRRDDLANTGATKTSQHGFVFDLTAMRLTAGRHAFQVYAVRKAAGPHRMLLPIEKEPHLVDIPNSQREQ